MRNVRINKTYGDRSIQITLSVDTPSISDTDLRRFRRALADAITEAFISRGHRLEELKNLAVAARPAPDHPNVVGASILFIGDVKREEFERFSDAFLRLLNESRQYNIEVVRGLKALHW